MIALLAALALAEEPATAVSASLVLQVTEPVEAADHLVAEARETGGWFQSRTVQSVSLRVPTDAVDALLSEASELGRVFDRSLQKRDLTAELAELRGRLEARQDVLERYYAVLAEAGSSSIVAVERQIVDAIAQIEALTGRIRVLEDQARWARVDVSFQFRDRSAPVADGPSSFPWLNTLHLGAVVEGFHADRPRWQTRGVTVAAPEGFSAWRRSSRYRAASPDGVLFRVRTVKNDPEADLSFWTEAARERLVGTGYKIVAEAPIEVSGRSASLFELAAPHGEEDWIYLVAFFVDGPHLAIAEAAGEATELTARRDAIVQAIQQLRP